MSEWRAMNRPADVDVRRTIYEARCWMCGTVQPQDYRLSAAGVRALLVLGLPRCVQCGSLGVQLDTVSARPGDGLTDSSIPAEMHTRAKTVRSD